MRFLGRKTSDLENKVQKSITALQDALKILSLGVDYRKYAKFRLLAPKVTRVLGGQYVFQDPETIKCSLDDCKFCHGFVIESAIRIQDFDFEVEK